MARVPYLQKSDLAPEDQALLDRNINLHRALVHSPGGARNFSRLGGYIRHQSTLDPRLRELAILQVGYLARSAYEYSHHIKIGRAFGVTDADIRGMIDDTEGRPSGLSALDRNVLLGAREITGAGKISAETYAALAAELSTEHLVDLVIVMSFYNAVVRLLASLEIDVEADYAPYLEEFPLPADD